MRTIGHEVAVLWVNALYFFWSPVLIKHFIWKLLYKVITALSGIAVIQICFKLFLHNIHKNKCLVWHIEKYYCRTTYYSSKFVRRNASNHAWRGSNGPFDKNNSRKLTTPYCWHYSLPARWNTDALCCSCRGIFRWSVSWKAEWLQRIH